MCADKGCRGEVTETLNDLGVCLFLQGFNATTTMLDEDEEKVMPFSNCPAPLLRFAAHVAIVLEAAETSLSEDGLNAKDTILCRYVDHLISAKNVRELICCVFFVEGPCFVHVTTSAVLLLLLNGRKKLEMSGWGFAGVQFFAIHFVWPPP